VQIPVLDINEHQNGAKSKKSHTNGNGHKTGSFENDVVIIEDECFGVVGHEEVVATVEEVRVEETSPGKKKRSRKSKDSTESKDSKLSEVPVQEETQGDDTTTPAEKEIKILKMNSEELLASKRRSDRLQNASTIVNLSTMSTNDLGSDETPPERRVSGRRSTRPIDEIKYTYRAPNPDDSTTNATIGSNESLMTTPGTDRKRRPINESSENLDSPKRSRLDLSGLFSSFSSPVAMLRNKFKRANIASTPVVGGAEAMLNESVESLDTTVGDEMKEIDLNEKGVDEVAVEAENEDVIIVKPAKSFCSVM
jgi:hypothetical protein